MLHRLPALRITAAQLPASTSSAPAQTAQRLKLVVSYDGSNFAGFQWQKGNVRTVQGEIEKAASRLFLAKGRIVGASRTDGGAHAHGQVAHYDVFGERDSLESDIIFFNGLLPPDVKVTQLERAPEGNQKATIEHTGSAVLLANALTKGSAGFDSHFSSSGKVYRYLLASGLPSPFEGKYRWWVYDRFCEGNRGKPTRLDQMALDVGSMQEAAEHLLGVHDFSAFADAKRPAGLGSLKRKKPKLAKLAEQGIKVKRTAAKNTRHIWRLDVQAEPKSGDVMIEIAGNGFLYRMVRMIAAGLVEVGHHRLKPAALRDILRSADRSRLPAAAPPHGLYLMEVLYDKELTGSPVAHPLGEDMLDEADEDEAGDQLDDDIQ